MLAYKITNIDYTPITGKHEPYEVGKTYIHTGPIKLGKSGYHACMDIQDCFMYIWNGEHHYRLLEVLVEGDVIHGKFKLVCSKMTILKDITDTFY